MTEIKPNPAAENLIKTLGKRAADYGEKYHGCAQATLAVLLEYFGLKDKSLLAAASCFAGGSTRCLCCGPLSAGFMIFGIKYGRQELKDSPEDMDKALELANQLTDRFLNKYGTTNCCELTGFDMRKAEQRELFKDSKETTDRCTERIQLITEWVLEIIQKKDGTL